MICICCPLHNNVAATFHHINNNNNNSNNKSNLNNNKLSSNSSNTPNIHSNKIIMGKRKSKTAKQKQARAATKQSTKVLLGGVSVVKEKARSTVETLKLPWSDSNKFKTPPTPKPSSNTTPRPMSTTPSLSTIPTTTALNSNSNNNSSSSIHHKRKMNDNNKDTVAAATIAAATKERQEFHQQLASLLERKSVAMARRSKRSKKHKSKGGRPGETDLSFHLAPATFSWNDETTNNATTTTRLVEEAMVQVQSFSIGTDQYSTTTTTSASSSSAIVPFQQQLPLPGTTNVLQVMAAQYRDQQQLQQQQPLLWTSPAAVPSNTDISANNPWAVLAADSDDDDDNNNENHNRHRKQKPIPFSFAPPSFSIAPTPPLLSMESLRIGGDEAAPVGSGGIMLYDDFDPDL